MARPVRLLHETLIASTTANPNQEAVIWGDERMSYGRYLEDVEQLAGALQARGLRRGDRVVILLENRPETLMAVFATSLAGGVFVVVHPQTRGEKLAFILRDSGASTLITHSDGVHRLAPMRSSLPDLTTIFMVGDDATSTLVDEALAGEVFAAREEMHEAPTPTSPDAIPLDLAALIYTSGSTGTPKGVMLSHQSMVFTLGSLVEYLRLDASDRLLNALPLAFDYGLYQALMASHLGASLVLERSFGYPSEVVRRMQEEHVTVFPGVPTMFATLLSLHRKTRLELPDVRRITNTAAHLPDAHIKKLAEVFPSALVYRMYGLTECKRVSFLAPELALEKPTSVGKAIPGTEAFILRPDGEVAAPGEDGILHVRGPHVMMGYWNRPEETAKMLVPGRWPGERMLCTQDVFRSDEDGYLYFVGRTDDIIKRGGEKVSPREIEEALHAVPGVREAAVIGVPDAVLGEAVRAFVMLDEGVNLTPRDIQRALLPRLEPTLIPREFIFVADLPRTDSGKVRKRDLHDSRPPPDTLVNEVAFELTREAAARRATDIGKES